MLSVPCISIVSFRSGFIGMRLEMLGTGCDDNKDGKISFGESCR